MANCGRMVRDSAMVTIESLYRKLLSLFRMVPSLIPYDLPFPQNGVLNTPYRTNFATHMIEDIDKAAVCHAGCHYKPSDIVFCHITLALLGTILSYFTSSIFRHFRATQKRGIINIYRHYLLTFIMFQISRSSLLIPTSPCERLYY